LLWVTPSYKITHAAQVDTYISAELPNKSDDPELYKIVTDSMMHGPCGDARPGSTCMRDGVCSKKFPKQHESKTRFDSEGHVYYKRSPGGEVFVKNDISLDSGYVVPYNNILCKAFNAHINVEYCGWSMLIKYLFKYISKGPDRVKFKISKANRGDYETDGTHSECTNEIQNFVDSRFICPHEAAWRILDFPIHHRNPAVQVLAVHLEGMQNISFKDKSNLANLLSNPIMKKTTLTEWLRNNFADPSGRDLTYVEYLSMYWWEGTGKG
jgi:hypothetical protein